MKKLYILIFVLTIALHHSSQAQCVDTTLQSPAIAPGNVEYVELEGGDGYLVGPGKAFMFTEFYQEYSLTDYSDILGIDVTNAPKDTVWIDKVYVFYGKRLLGANPGKIVSKVYSVVVDTFANLVEVSGNLVGTPCDAPDTIGYLGISDSLSMTSLPAVMSTFNEEPLFFPKPVPITLIQDSFFVSIVMSTSPGDTLAIGNSLPGGSISPPFPGASGGSYQLSGERLFYTYNFLFNYEIPSLAGDNIDIGILPHLTCTNPLAGIKNVNDDELFVMPFPNPATTVLYLGYDISRSEVVKVTLTDMLGRIVADLGTKNEGSGTHTEQIDVSGLSTGMYVYRVETTNGIATGKIMVSH